MNIKCQAIRGATTVDSNSEALILSATKDLLEKVIQSNELSEKDIISIFFTATTDLNAAFPAKAAREMGLLNTPLMCGQEIEVPDALALCIRIIMHVNTSKEKEELIHIYEKAAISLRPDQQRKD